MMMIFGWWRGDSRIDVVRDGFYLQQGRMEENDGLVGKEGIVRHRSSLCT